jgi:hypothetical protein
LSPYFHLTVELPLKIKEMGSRYLLFAYMSGLKNISAGAIIISPDAAGIYPEMLTFVD